MHYMINLRNCEHIELFNPADVGNITTDGERTFPMGVGFDKRQDSDTALFSLVRGYKPPVRYLQFSESEIIDEDTFNHHTGNSRDQAFPRIVLEYLPRNLVGHAYSYYTQTTVATMEAVDFKGEIVVDFGSGSGVLSFIALRRGAREAVLIEQNPDAMDLACASAALSQFPPGSLHYVLNKIEWVCMNPRHYAPDLIEKATVGLANIGPQRIYGGQEGVQLSVLETVRNRGSRIQTMILGGFAEGEDLGPDYIVGRYQELGFSPVAKVWMSSTGRPVQTAVVLQR